MKLIITSPATAQYLTGVNYKVGDKVVPKDNPEKIYGTCTGFENGCVFIDGKNYGGMYFFMKSEWQEADVIFLAESKKGN